ncbi:hypothetical protein A2U01_0110200, partial [Trifolium medium]|nr:hypothetical protein [Trifolium medium]
MHIYESNLATYFHEEEFSDAKATELKGKLARLEGMKKE